MCSTYPVHLIHLDFIALTLLTKKQKYEVCHCVSFSSHHVLRMFFVQICEPIAYLPYRLGGLDSFSFFFSWFYLFAFFKISASSWYVISKVFMDSVV